MSNVGNLVVDGLPSPELLVQTPGALARGSDLTGRALQGARLLGASALAVYGVQRRGWLGLGALAAGAWLARSAMNLQPKRAKQRWTTAEAAITIGGTPQQLFDAWREPEAFARHLSHLRCDGEDPKHEGAFRFSARAPDGRLVRWRARCAHVVPGESIAWRTLDDEFPWSCDLSFRPATRHRGTEVRLRLVYGPPAGDVGQIADGGYDDLDSSQSVATDLRRFKQLMESGEVATIEGQSRGPSHPRPLSAERPPLAEDRTPVLALDEASTPVAEPLVPGRSEPARSGIGLPEPTPSFGGVR
jgi:uncharacterized membrane protein